MEKKVRFEYFVLIEDVLKLSKLSNKEIPFVKTDLESLLKRINDDPEISMREKNGKIQLIKLSSIEAVSG